MRGETEGCGLCPQCAEAYLHCLCLSEVQILLIALIPCASSAPADWVTHHRGVKPSIHYSEFHCSAAPGDLKTS